jgi:hypothetical protein
MIQFTIVASDTQAADTTCVYGLMGTIAGTTGSFSHVQLQVFNPYIKIREYKRASSCSRKRKRRSLSRFPCAA